MALRFENKSDYSLKNNEYQYRYWSVHKLAEVTNVEYHINGNYSLFGCFP